MVLVQMMQARLECNLLILHPSMVLIQGPSEGIDLIRTIHGHIVVDESYNVTWVYIVDTYNKNVTRYCYRHEF